MKLPLQFYLREDVVKISKELLGKHLYTQIDGVLTGGQITETEAYQGITDRACHAYQGRRTKRTEVMYREGGICYIYMCYGMHFLLNVVTYVEGEPHAVLIRAIKPEVGMDQMKKRRSGKELRTNGPALVTQALGIGPHLNGSSLLGDVIWIEEGQAPSKIQSSARIGVDYAGEDAKLPWRFFV